jgi:hypothetical protein
MLVELLKLKDYKQIMNHVILCYILCKYQISDIDIFIYKTLITKLGRICGTFPHYWCKLYLYIVVHQISDITKSRFFFNIMKYHCYLV